MKKYDMALIEVPEDEAISKNDVEELMGMLDGSRGIVPLYIPGDTSYAMGFCTNEAFTAYEERPVKREIQDILYDMSLENEDGNHNICGLNVYLCR